MPAYHTNATRGSLGNQLYELYEAHKRTIHRDAADVWQLVESLQASRERFVTVAYHPAHNVLVAVGPYNTDNQARKDVVNRVVQTGGTQVRIARLYAPESVDLDGESLVKR